MASLLGVAFVEIRSILASNFKAELVASIGSAITEANELFAAGSAEMQAAATQLEVGIAGRYAGMAAAVTASVAEIDAATASLAATTLGASAATAGTGAVGAAGAGAAGAAAAAGRSASTQMAAVASSIGSSTTAISRDVGVMESAVIGRMRGLGERAGLSEFSSHVSRMAGTVGPLMSIALPAAFAIGAVEIIKEAGEFQSQLNLLVSAAGEKRSELEGIGQGIMSISRLTGTSLDMLSEGEYNIEKAGFRGAESLVVLRAAAEGARAEGAELGTVVNALTSIMASYHIGADGAIGVTNQIVAAAGEAKTSMQNYASSLSTVLPIASAAGVSFAEVGGAIATLTQHGTSAAESTQELANTIRNLQSPNAVATKAMQQLGIDVTDLSTRLGERGLTGTIELITSKITSQMGPAGLVLMDAFNKSKTAAQDAGVMFSHLSPQAQEIAQQFQDGSLGLKDFRVAMMDLPGPQGNLLRQWQTLENTASGFSNQLKSGGPAAQTYVAALKSVLGGSTALNTVLQLSGESFDGFTERVARVQSAAQNAGHDIETWSDVQQSFNVQMSQAKQAIVTTAVGIGMSWIPTVSRAVTGIGDFVSGLDESTAVAHVFGALGAVLSPVFSAIGAGIGLIVHFIIDDLFPAFERLGPFLGSVESVAQSFATGLEHVFSGSFSVISAVLHGFGVALGAVFGFISHYGADIAKFGASLLILVGITRGVSLGVLALNAVMFNLRAAFVLAPAFLASAGTALLAFGRATGLVQVAMAAATVATTVWGFAMREFQAISLSVAILGLVNGIVNYVAATRLGVLATTAFSGALRFLVGLFTFLDFRVIAAAVLSFASAEGIAAVASGVLSGALGVLRTAISSTGIGALVVLAGTLAAALVGIGIATGNTSSNVYYFGQALNDVMSVGSALFDVLTGLITLDFSKMGSGIGNIFSGLGSAFSDVAGGLANNLYHGIGKIIGDASMQAEDVAGNFGIDVGNSFVHGLLVSANSASGAISTWAAGTVEQLSKLSTAADSTSFDKYGEAIQGSIDTAKEAGGEYAKLAGMTDTMSVSIYGLTIPSNAWHEALSQTNNDQEKAVELYLQATAVGTAYATQISAMEAAQSRFNDMVAGAAVALNIETEQVGQYASIMGVTASQVASGGLTQDAFNSAVQSGSNVMGTANTAVLNFENAYLKYIDSAQTATDKTDLFRAAVDALTGRGGDLNVALSNESKTLRDLTDQLTGSTDSAFTAAGAIDIYSDSGNNLVNTMSTLKGQIADAGQEIFNTDLKTMSAGDAARDAAQKMVDMGNAAVNNLVSSLHLSSDQAAALTEQLGLVPSDVPTLAHFFDTDARTAIGGFNSYLTGNPPRNVTTTANFSDGDARAKAQNLGGYLLTYFNNLNPTVNVKVNNPQGSSAAPPPLLLPAANMFGSITKFASGGFNMGSSVPESANSHIAQVVPQGTYRLFGEKETGGEAYIPLADGKRQRSTNILGQVASSFGYTLASPDRFAEALRSAAASGVGRGFSAAISGVSAQPNPGGGVVYRYGDTTVVVNPSQGMNETLLAKRVSAEQASSVRIGTAPASGARV